MKNYYDMRVRMHPDDAHYSDCIKEDKIIVIRIRPDTVIRKGNVVPEYFYINGVETIGGFKRGYDPRVYAAVLPTSQKNIKILQRIQRKQSMS